MEEIRIYKFVLFPLKADGIYSFIVKYEMRFEVLLCVLFETVMRLEPLLLHMLGK